MKGYIYINYARNGRREGMLRGGGRERMCDGEGNTPNTENNE